MVISVHVGGCPHTGYIISFLHWHPYMHRNSECKHQYAARWISERDKAVESFTMARDLLRSFSPTVPASFVPDIFGRLEQFLFSSLEIPRQPEGHRSKGKAAGITASGRGRGEPPRLNLEKSFKAPTGTCSALHGNFFFPPLKLLASCFHDNTLY